MAATCARVLVFLVALVLVLLVIAIGALETGWAKNQIRALIVRQANQYLTATLAIGRLEGSLFRGLQLGDVTVSRNGQPIIRIDDIALTYSLRELWQEGVVIKRIRLTRPLVNVARESDGRWNLGALIKRDARQEERTGPQRPIEIQSIEVADGVVLLRDPLSFGAANIPSSFTKLDASLSFAYRPVTWTLTFKQVSWVGRDPELDMTRLAGGMGFSPAGWSFNKLSVQTPQSAFTLDGRINRQRTPSELALDVHAERFAFQEWAGVLHGLKNIAITASFNTKLEGPLDALETELRLAGTGGDVSGQLKLDTTVPGWRGVGEVDVARLNLAKWLNRVDRPSDITGHVTFNLDLDLGRHFPRGVYAFRGPHVGFMEYAADNLNARGRLTASEVVIEMADAVAYGAQVTTTTGSIGIDEPFPFRFQGGISGLDLRGVPASVPVPRVDSVLAFAYDVSGQFRDPFIIGRAQFDASHFLGASIGAGTIGSIDTSQKPLRFSGDGSVDDLQLARVGRELEIGWLQDPRYIGTVSGQFHVQGTGTDRATLELTAGGRIGRAQLFRGAVSDADVTLDIARGTLSTSFDGRFSGVDPAVAVNDSRFAASLTGSARLSTTVHELLTRTPVLGDYDISGRTNLQNSTVRDVAVTAAQFDGSLHDGLLTLARLDVAGPILDGHAAGSVMLDGVGATNLTYDITRADLSRLLSLTGQAAAGMLSARGTLTGARANLHTVGDAQLSHLDAYGVQALTLNGHYDATSPADMTRIVATVTGDSSFVNVLGQSLQQASGTVTVSRGEQVGFDLKLLQASGRAGSLAGTVRVAADRHRVDLVDLTISLGASRWRLDETPVSPVVSWTDEGVSVTPLTLTGGAANDERIGVSGTWREDGNGALHVTASHVFLETLQGAFERPTRYGGVVDADAIVRGTVERPTATGTVTITNGRVERVTYEKLAGRVGYAGDSFDIDVRLDQAPGIWLTAVGKVPRALFTRELPDSPIDVAIKSSPIDLGLLEGLTGAVRQVSGRLNVDVKAVGTSRDPHFDGSVGVTNAAFQLTSTGAKYKNARAALLLARDRVTVDSLHVEDSAGHPLDMHGSLATHELRVGDLAMDLTARGFEVIRNEFGRVDLNAALSLRGPFESPRATGTITIQNGDIKVDEILDRALFRPYSTEAEAAPRVGAVAALNPWDRLGLDLSVHFPPTVKLTGTDVQISPGTPIGLGDIDLRVGGDLYLYKDPGQPLSTTGSLDRISGTYRFQGRVFDIDEKNSSINFHSDLNPYLYVTVTRVISAVETRVTIAGELRRPELRLASNPPLDPSDILSLIVFNASPADLTAAQQQELAVRAGALAAGFLATPLVTAIRNEIGIDVLEVEPGGRSGTGARVTVGEEIAPGLIARFSREFGQEAYDEATIEYYLSRLLRLRATFSDAQALGARPQFRRVERAGIDLLLFFSF